MAKVIKFPPNALCPRCGIEPRPATTTEIERGLTSDDQQTRQLFAHAVQGDVVRRFTVEDKFTSMLEDNTPPARVIRTLLPQ